MPIGALAIPNSVTKTIVCINDFTGAEYVGVLFNPYMPQPVPFADVRQMISILESFFDDISFPQAFCDLRSFRGDRLQPRERADEIQLFLDQPEKIVHRGRLGTFVLNVQFRRNATWQGELTWMEQHKTRKFLSILEMLRLVNTALENGSLPDSFVSWDSL